MRWLLCLLLLAPFERIVATLDGRPITSVELGRYQALFHPELDDSDALDQLLRLLVLDLQAQRYQIRAPEDQIAIQLARLDPTGQVRQAWAMEMQDLRHWAARQVRVHAFLNERFYRWQTQNGRLDRNQVEREIDQMVQELEERWHVQRQL